jgi:hypothetical protein
MSNFDTVIWILLIGVFLIIIGLYLSEFTPLNLDEKERILKLNYITENFSPDVSSSDDQSEGASQLYNWGLEEKIYHNEKKQKNQKKECPHTPKCEKPCYLHIDNIERPSPPSIKYDNSPSCQNNYSHKSCDNCDITMNKDIDKYVLKSSVPACPDMSEYITKNMMNANPDLSDYILKSEIQPCDKPDLSNYILKSEVKSCDQPDLSNYMLKSEIKACEKPDLSDYILKSQIPTCPICPTCPDHPESNEKHKQIFEYNIMEHPDISKYISVDELKKSYVRRSDMEHILEETERKYSDQNKEEKRNWNQDLKQDHKQDYKQDYKQDFKRNTNRDSNHTLENSMKGLFDITNYKQDRLNNTTTSEEILKKSKQNNDDMSILYRDNEKGYYTGDSNYNSVGVKEEGNIMGYYAGDNAYAGF